jgi:integrase
MYASRYVKQYLGHMSVKDVGPPHVRQWSADMHAAGVSVSNQSKSAQLAGMLFRSAMADGVAIANPCSVVPAPKPARVEIVFLTPEQIKAFLIAADKNRMFGLFNLALGTGARLGEMLALTWKDVNFEAGTVTFQRTLSEVDNVLSVKDCKTAAGRRTVMLPRFVIEALHEQRKNNVMEGLAGCELCFPSKRGTYQRRSNVARHYFKPAQKRTHERLS